MPLFVVDYMEGEEHKNFLGHLENTGVSMLFASFFLFLFGLNCTIYLNPIL